MNSLNVCNSNQMSFDKRYLNTMDSTRYHIIQIKGQRVYGPPPHWPTDQLPPKDCEVFLGRLPRDCFEDELIPVFAAIGPIYQFRLMVDFSGSNKGFGFVTYTNKSDARNAVRLLDRYQIRPNHPIGVKESLNNCRLYIGNLPSNLSSQYICDVMSTITPGVVRAQYNRTLKYGFAQSRGFAIIEYRTHHDAAMARRKILPQENFKLFGIRINLEWAKPKPQIYSLSEFGHKLSDRLNNIQTLRRVGNDFKL